jgi:hypothetical protein
VWKAIKENRTAPDFWSLQNIDKTCNRIPFTDDEVARLKKIYADVRACGREWHKSDFAKHARFAGTVEQNRANYRTRLAAARGAAAPSAASRAAASGVDNDTATKYSQLLEQQPVLRMKEDAMDQGEEKQQHTPQDSHSAPAAAASPSASSAPVLPVIQPALAHSLSWMADDFSAAPPGGAHDALAAAAHSKERPLAKKRRHSRAAIAAEEDMQQLREFEVQVKQAKLEAMEAQLKAMQGRLKAKQIALVSSDDEED